MSRTARILGTIGSSVVIFGLSAVAGWAITGAITEADAPLPTATIEAIEYPLQPISDDPQTQFDDRVEELMITEEAFEGTPQPTGLGDPSAGGQTMRSITVPTAEVDASLGEEDRSSSSTTAADTDPSSEPESSDTPFVTPSVVLLEDPRIRAAFDLSDALIVPPIPAIRNDGCAGSDAGAEPPAGCPGGVGGTILLIDETGGPPNVLLTGLECEPVGADEVSVTTAVFASGTLRASIWLGGTDSVPPSGTPWIEVAIPEETLDHVRNDEYAAFCMNLPLPGQGEITVEATLFPGEPGPEAATYISSDQFTFRHPGGRPPTGRTAHGVDSLYVRTFRTTSEYVQVRAMPIDDSETPQQVCDLGTDAISGPQGRLPGDSTSDRIHGEPTLSVTLDDPSGWAYDVRYNTLDVHHLRLDTGSNYAVCVYFIDTRGGVSGTLSQTEASFVATPATRTIELSILGFRTTPDSPNVDGSVAEIVALGSRSCFTRIDWPRPNTSVQMDGAAFCEYDSGLTFVDQNGGFLIRSRFYPNNAGDTPPPSDAWIPVDSSDLRCSGTCDSGDTRTTTIPVRGADLSASGRTRVPVGYLDVQARFVSGANNGFDRWELGSNASYEPTSAPLPDEPQIRVMPGNLTRYEVGDANTWAVTRSFVLRSDRNVSLSATLIPTERADGSIVEPCVADPAGNTAIDQAFLSGTSFFELSGMCLGHPHTLEVEATDDAGHVTTRQLPVSTTSTDWAIEVSGTLRLGPSPIHRFQISNENEFYRVYPLSVNTPSSRDSAGPALLPGISDGPRPPGNGWASPRPDRTCMRHNARDQSTPEPPTPRVFTLTSRTPVWDEWRIAVPFDAGRFEHDYDDPPCSSRPISPRGVIIGYSPWIVDERWSLGGTYSLADILNGFEVTSTDGLHTLTIEGRWTTP